MDMLPNFFSDLVVTRAIAASLSLVLLAGAWQKLRDPLLFAGALENYRLLPGGLVSMVAYLLPLLEGAAGLLLLFPETAAFGGFLTVFLLVTVTAAVLINLLRGRTSIDCGCGGLSSQPLSWALVARNAVLLLLACIAIHQGDERPLFWADYVTTGGAILALLGIYVSVNQLLTNAPMALAVRK